ncbi:MAG: aspartate/glutamate racemase family protein [Methylobacteriaceae bacterium]|nr:aspartate/glutamate racemase family protein [Methylobacteriaceae bacterium]
MRLLLINPNTTEAITASLAVAARAALPGVEVVAATGRFGARYIASRVSFAIAGHAAVDAFAEQGAACDAVLLACFGDPGLDALREIAPVPVIGLVEAACAEAGADGRRFSIVTGGERWESMLRETLAARGLDARLASIRAVAPSGGDIARDPDGALAGLAASCRRCVEDDGAEAVILGGAGLIGLAGRLQPRLSTPLVCSVAAGFRAADAALRAPPAPAPPMPAPVDSVGLSSPLAELLAGRRAPAG